MMSTHEVLLALFCRAQLARESLERIDAKLAELPGHWGPVREQVNGLLVGVTVLEQQLERAARETR